MTTRIEVKGTPWKVDEAEMVQAIMKTGVDPIESIIEAVQNGDDSVLPPNEESDNLTWDQVYSLPNEINIHIPDKKERRRHPRSKDGRTFICSVSDKGLSITKDYDYDINKLVNAAKGTSTKRRNRWSKGRKGIGMLQYMQFANIIEVVSQDSKNKRLIYKFDIYMDELNGKKFPYYSKPQSYPINPDNQKKYGIHNDGTVLSFFNETEATKAIPKLAEQVKSKIRDTFGLEMVRKPNLTIRVNGQKLEAPEYLQQYEEIPIIPKLDITGNIYEDKEGLGEIKIIGEGGIYITDHRFSMRRCSGYLICEKWIPDTGRKSVNKDQFWQKSVKAICKYLEQFSELKRGNENPIEKKTKDMMEKFALKLLTRFHPDLIVHGSHDKKKITEKENGNLYPIDGEGITTGYAPYIPKEELDPNGEFIEHQEYARNNTHQQQVGLIGNDSVILTKEQEDKSQEKPLIIWQIVDLDPSVALLELVRDQNPWVLFVNRKNPLYALKKLAAKGQDIDYIQSTDEQWAILLMELDYEYGKLTMPQTIAEIKKTLEEYTIAVYDSA